MADNTKATWQGWTVGILGLWIFIAAFLKFTPKGNMWDNLIVGIIIGIVALYMIKPKPWQGWLSLIVGVWLIIAAFIPSLQAHTANLWNDAISGILAMIGGFAALGNGGGAKAES